MRLWLLFPLNKSEFLVHILKQTFQTDLIRQHQFFSRDLRKWPKLQLNKSLYFFLRHYLGEEFVLKTSKHPYFYLIFFQNYFWPAECFSANSHAAHFDKKKCHGFLRFWGQSQILMTHIFPHFNNTICHVFVMLFNKI